jgi:hypothetical protein
MATGVTFFYLSLSEGINSLERLSLSVFSGQSRKTRDYSNGAPSQIFNSYQGQTH